MFPNEYMYIKTWLGGALIYSTNTTEMCPSQCKVVIATIDFRSRLVTLDLMLFWA